MNIGALLKAGFSHMQDEHAELEKTKIGILRGGNSGLADYDGTKWGVTGTCHRKTYLRLKGIDLNDIDDDRHIMFGGGRTNEDFWYDLISRTYPHKILREEEVPIKWTTDNGTLVTGRPDMVLCDSAARPQLGLELKMASSLWTCREVINGRPKQPHLIQAAHYSWKLGIPFQLWYTAYVDFAVTGWAQKHFPRQGELGSDYCAYNEKGEIVKTLPFQIGFELRWEADGTLSFKRADTTDKWQHTIITSARISNYYNVVANMEEKDTLGPRPENLKFDGSKMSWNMCDAKYCPLAATCDKFKDNSSLRVWTEEVQKTITPSTKE